MAVNHTHGASTSNSKEEDNLEFEELSKEQRLKAALYHGIKQISKEVEEDMGTRISSQVLATLCESLNRQAEIYAVDLELFAKHAKRTNISVDDVKLLARRNQQLLNHLDSIVAEHTSEKEASKKPRKVKGQDKPRSKKGPQSKAAAGTVVDVNEED